LFSESPCRLLITVRPDQRSAFEKVIRGFPLACVGEVTHDQVLKVTGLSGLLVIDADIRALKKAWQEPLGT